jgi:ribonuclease T1
VRLSLIVPSGLESSLFRTAYKFATKLLLVTAVWAEAAASASSGQLPTISQQALPEQGVETYLNIQRGGPFPFEKDGVVFGNRERILPLQKRGYYLEYTVKTPGSRNRGAQRIVCGGPATAPETCYYTADHYASFRMIVP